LIEQARIWNSKRDKRRRDELVLNRIDEAHIVAPDKTSQQESSSTVYSIDPMAHSTESSQSSQSNRLSLDENVSSGQCVEQVFEANALDLTVNVPNVSEPSHSIEPSHYPIDLDQATDFIKESCLEQKDPSGLHSPKCENVVISSTFPTEAMDSTSDSLDKSSRTRENHV
jgi:hypothetical protein